ncbi:two-component system regulatory protein YycI [Shimazuella sp. AN120528]|uniref:two-component system regulatory protein YycI n=1 Tax=Shimazuella soli TaxID=1892854 RepID=UPI001F0F035E|nr:two-component system regulatory protein YycI [Shimazuella soli]MCH5585078.1 two-component system regulatory protein YycI [Shimazuella soli]
MDWQRAQNYLITAFVLVNLFLIFQIQQTMEQKNASLAVDKISNTQIRSLLTDNHFELDVPRPKDVAELKIWQGTPSKISGWQELNQGYQKRIAPNTMVVHNVPELKAVLSKEVPYFSEYQLQSKPHKLTGEWIFVQHIDRRPLYGGRVEVEVANNQIQSIYMNHFDLQETSKVFAVTDFNTALYNLINATARSRTQHIKKIQLGYQTQAYNNGTYFFIPVWRFWLDEKQYDVYAISFGSVKSVEVVK